MTAAAITRPLCTDQASASTADPLVFFLHVIAPDGRDIMPGPFAAGYTNQDQATAEAKAALSGTGYQPRSILFNVAVPVDELPGELLPWNEGEGLRLFGIEQGGQP